MPTLLCLPDVYAYMFDLNGSEMNERVEVRKSKNRKSCVMFAVPGDADAVGSESVAHPTYVQYVEGDGSTYIPTNGQM